MRMAEVVHWMTGFGMGVTNCAMVAALFIHNFKPSGAVVPRTGSRLDPRIRAGDTVISLRMFHHAAASMPRAKKRFVLAARAINCSPWECF